MTAGEGQTCATRTDHTLWCWGDNGNGELGLGDETNRVTPTQVGMAGDWTRISTGDGPHTCAVRVGHTGWCWGFNASGQLGVGDHISRSVPTRL